MRLYNADKTTIGDAINRGFLTQYSVNGNVHRLAIFDAAGEITRVVSMSDAVRFLSAHADGLGELADSTLRNLGGAEQVDTMSTPNQPGADRAWPWPFEADFDEALAGCHE